MVVVDVVEVDVVVVDVMEVDVMDVDSINDHARFGTYHQLDSSHQS